MKKLLVFFAITLSFGSSYAQDEGRTMLRGTVLYRGSNVVNENVINITTEDATITNDDGEFLIAVKVDDELVFTAVNFQLRVIKITPEIIKNNRLVVDVNEKITALDEVVVSPENQEKFIALQEEKFKEYEYEIDRATEVVNTAESQTVRGLQDGLNFVNIFKALVRSKDKGVAPKRQLRMSEVLRQIYDEEFFVEDLKLPREKIGAFLFYCDDQMPSQSLLKKDNEFQLIDFLVTTSQTYLKDLNTEE